ncbi:MAG TPA: acylphosphatase [Dehalococcoidia bacterium]
MAEADRAALRAVVRGRVQGVGFRQFVEWQARRAGLVGWVRNLPDGASVEVAAEGPRPALEDLLRALYQGPRLARVESVEAEWGPAAGRFRDFEIVW